MNKPFMVLKRLLPRLIVLFTVILTGCQPVKENSWQSPWQLVREITGVTAHLAPALWANTRTRILAWPGSPNVPNLRLLDTQRNPEPLQLPLGIRPGSVNIYPLAGDWFQLLWIDQTLPGQPMLVGGTIDETREVQRGPTEISHRATVEYTAIPTPGGDLAIVWAESGNVSTPLYMMLLDSGGRPREPVLLSRSGRHPSGVFAANGDLHIAWLEPGSEGLWTIQYAIFPGGKIDARSATAAIAETIPVGVFRLGSDQAVDSFALGLDGKTVYLIWGTIRIGQNGILGALAGLTLPIGPRTSGSQQPISLNFNVLNFPPNLSLRWLTPARGPIAADALIASVSASNPGDLSWHDRPLILTITPSGITSAQAVTNGISGDGPLGPTALNIDSDGALHIAWTVLRDNGVNAIYLASTRP